MVTPKGKNIFSFSDAYGLSLIASGLPGVNHVAIVSDLSPQAKRIGNALIAKSPSKKSGHSTKKAAKGKTAPR
jgi:hypothetical protein